MNILILGSKEYPIGSSRNEDRIPSGGMETYIDDLSFSLSKKCRICIITRKFRFTKQYEKRGNIKVYRVGWFKGFYFRNLSFNFYSFFKSFSVIRKNKIKIIYTQGIIASVLSFFLSSLLHTKTVCRPAGLCYGQYKFPLGKIIFIMEREMYKRADCVIFHSEEERLNLIKKLKIKLKKYKVIPTGFPVEKFNSRDKSLKKDFGFKKDDIIVTAVARYHPVKGLEYLIEAIHILKNKKIKLLLVGEGPERKKYERIIKKLDLADEVLLTGFRYDIPKILSISDLFVVSSLSEGLPTSLLEAMSAGIPPIVTDIGLPIINKINGLVIKPQNSKIIAESIEFLIQNPQMTENISKEARRFIKKNYSIDKTVNLHLEVFKSLLG